MKFVNRVKEMELLQEEYEKPMSTFSVIYGRRRTGKTTLIREFLKNKNALYFFADTQSETLQIKRMQEHIAETFNDNFIKNIHINSWDTLFEYLVSKLKSSEKFILVLDEFQYLVTANKEFSSIFQRVYDTLLKEKNIMIILCGSIIGMMYSQVLSYTSPLYGRRTSQINLKQINFKYYSDFFEQGVPVENLIEYYSITGGIPKYIEVIDTKLPILECIKREFLDKDKFLYQEARFLLQEEVNEVSTYFSILQTIASGEHKLSGITKRMEVSSHSITAFLKKLIDLDKIEKRVPITEDNPEKSKKGLYYIKDNYLKFWFKFIFPYHSYLEINKIDYVMEQIQSRFILHVSETFEELSQEILLTKFSDFPIKKVGRWWDNETEIDLVAVGENAILYGECKWSIKRVGLSVLESLKQKAQRVSKKHENVQEYFALFSKSGFSPELIEYSKSHPFIKLYSLEEL